MHFLEIFIDSDSLIEVDKLTDASDDTFLNAATITGTLKDNDEVDVPGAETIAFVYVAASDGKYQGTIVQSVTLVKDAKYWLELTTNSGSLDRFDRIRCKAVYLAGK